MLLYYVRHGDPIYDPDSLTPLGHKQAEALSGRLARKGLDEIYASSSVRAQLTAQYTCEKLGKEKTILDWMNEGYAFEDVAVCSDDGAKTWCFHMEEYRKLFSSPEVCALGDRWCEHEYFKDTNFTRGVQRINKEVDEFMLSLGYKHDRENRRYQAVAPNEKRIGVFAHQGFGMMFLSSLLDIPYNLFAIRFDLSCSSMSVLVFETGGDGFVYPKLLQLANDSHLYKEGVMEGGYNGIDL